MTIINLAALKPLGFFIILGLAVMLLPSMLLPVWIDKANTITDQVQLISENLNQETLWDIQRKADLLAPLNSSATNLARSVQSCLNETELSFHMIESKAAPLLFEAFSTIPYVTQVSYVGLDGLLFSYYKKENQQTFLVYSNSSTTIPQNATTKEFTWFSEPVNPDTGKRYGENVTNANRGQGIMNITKGFSSLGTSWIDSQDLLFINNADLFGKGVISLGYQVNLIANLITGVHVNGGSSYLATHNGIVLREGTIPNTRMVVDNSLVSFELLNSNGHQIGHAGDFTCQPHDGKPNAQFLNIWETNYMLYCSTLQIVGVDSVYVSAIPQEGSVEKLMHQNFKYALVLLVLMFVTMLVAIICFVVLLVRKERREMYLQAAYIKQMEATLQAERKSMKKSNAYANASHDVRAALAGITGLIEICRGQVAAGCELDASLVLMESCSRDLLGIVNSILDTSKIEAEKMELEEEEFEVPQLFEDVADLFHTVGMRKGVDVVLDLHEDSIAKFSRVKGDRVKLKQILCNLVSNAVKFTSEGSVCIRAYARKPTSDSLFLGNANGSYNPLKWLSRWFLKKEEARNDYQTVNAQHEENRMEFIVEVDDTGKGIPKEKAKSVFENYVQVKETSHGQEGTGLGLGIVQSLVRLMGGEIGIVDKGAGEKGTCFKFNTYLTVCGAGNEGEYANSNRRSSVSHGQSTLFSTRPRVESSQVVLFMQSEERLKVAKKTMEHKGIHVSAVSHYEEFLSTLNNFKQKLLIFPNSSSQKSDENSVKSDCLNRAMSRNSSTRSKQVALSMLDGTDQAPAQPTKRRTGSRTTSFILIVVDTSAAAFRDISSAIAEFRKDLGDIRSRVVWVEKHGTSKIHSEGLHEDRSHADDMIIFKPFHGSRLQQVMGTLPECGGVIPAANLETINIFSAGNATSEASASRRPIMPTLPAISVEQTPGEIVQIGGPLNTEKPLSGRKVLVAEDDMVLRKIATSVIAKLGATVDTCVNGQEAVDTICNSLTNQRNSGAVVVLPYDFIFMDCEMPIMDGFEATRRIREEEKQNGVHIPIIAVSAHTDGPELRRMTEAGMDSHVPKPLNPTKLMKVLVDINDG